MKDTVQRLWNQYENLHYNIWEQEQDPESVRYDTNEFISFEEQVVNAILKIEESTDVKGTGSASTAQISALKLQRIEIPKFKGDYLVWKQFHNLSTKRFTKKS